MHAQDRKAAAVTLLAALLIALPAEVPGQGNSQIPFQPALVAPKNGQYPAVLPFRYWRGSVPVVDCFLNKATFGSFALDTGLNGDAVSPDAYKQFALPAGKVRARFTIMQTTPDALQASIDSLRAGTVAVSNVPVVITDVASLLSAAPHPDAPSGWLGTPFLAAFQVTFDFEHHVVVLTGPDSPAPNDKGAVIVPLEMRDGRPWVKVEVPPAKTFTALVDTGTMATLVPPDIAAKLKLKPGIVSHVRGANSQQSRIGYAVAPKVTVGKSDQADIPVAFLAPDAPPSFDRTFAILGVDFLERYRVTFNYAKKRMILAPLVPPADTGSDTSNDANP